MVEKDYICPSCGEILVEGFGTDPMTGEDEHTFECHNPSCYEMYEADEIIEENPND